MRDERRPVRVEGVHTSIVRAEDEAEYRRIANPLGVDVDVFSQADLDAAREAGTLVEPPKRPLNEGEVIIRFSRPVTPDRRNLSDLWAAIAANAVAAEQAKKQPPTE